jgi:hypothetical protein
MKTLCLSAVLLFSGPSLPAQWSGIASDREALQLHTTLVEGLKSGTITVDSALARLKAGQAPTGLGFKREADLPLAIIDIGRRLLVAGKPAPAEQLFRAAEASLDGIIKKLPNTKAREKAQYLEKRAFIRSQYLNKIALAKADFDEAIRLQPDDRHLRQLRDALASGQPALLKEQAMARARRN